MKTITFDEIHALVARHQASRRTVPSTRTTTVTELGAATVAALRLGRHLAQLDGGVEMLRVATLATQEAARLLDPAEQQTA